ncbi:MAG: phosphotransferase family protein [Lentisphaeria bacterium]
MRDNIYYWKCDSPLSYEEKRTYNDKYQTSDITATVAEIASVHFSGSECRVEATGSAGNHYAYLLHVGDETWFFRADDGRIDDDYMDAESAVMARVREAGVPVPEVIVTDTSLDRFPVRYQIMAFVPHPSLRELDQDGTLDRVAVSRQLGGYVARFHGIGGDRYGFLNTEHLRDTGEFLGLDATHADFFHKCLDDHLGYLRDVDFLDADTVRGIRGIFAKFADLLNLEQPALVHKDLAFWNVVGTNREVMAIIDWDDAVLGDPVDDLSIPLCFYHSEVIEPLLEGYREHRELPDDFDERVSLYLLRNMLWKAKIRHFMGYFDMGSSFFIRSRENADSLEAFTRARIQMAMTALL